MLRIAEPVITADDRAAMADVAASGWVSGYSPVVGDFESAFSEWVGVRHGVATPSGSTALHLALSSLGIGPGDEVIVPTLSHIAAYLAIHHVGATPVLCDSLPDTWNVDPAAVRSAITERTRAILVVHIYGLPCDMEEIGAAARTVGALVVEDAAEAHGATYRGRRAGSLGDVGCFSFFANKVITCGEGGMIVTDDDAVASAARSLKDLGAIPGRRYEYGHPGFGYRMPAASAALGRSQLRRVEELGARRIRNADLYREMLSDVDGITFAARPEDRVGSDWMVGVLVGDPFSTNRSGLQRRLSEADIETRPFFVPVHRQVFGPPGSYPAAERLSEQGLLLPSGSNLQDDDVERVAGVIREVAGV